MNHLKVKQLKYFVDLLINHCLEKRVVNTTLNYALVRNKAILDSAVEKIDKSVSEELKELERKAFDQGNEVIKKTTEEEKDLPEEKKTKFDNPFTIGFELLSEEEKGRHKELADDYNKFIQEESDVKLYTISLSKIEDVQLELEYIEILENFIKE